MFNVDTIFLGMNLEERQKEIKTLMGENKTVTDFEYVRTVNEKIKSRLYLDRKNRKKLQKVIEMQNIAKSYHFKFSRKDLSRELDIFRCGKDGGYGFFYNETRHRLSIHLQHWLVEDFTADEIINNTKQELMNYFGLTVEELEPLTLRRIDYYCDYRYKDDNELKVIKNIMTKVTDNLYSYNKEITDKPEKYVVKYLALKGKEAQYEETKFTISKRTIVDKEEDDEYYET